MALKFPDLSRLQFLAPLWGNRPSHQPEYFSLLDLGSDTIKAVVVQVADGQIHVLGHSLVPAEGKRLAGSRAEEAMLAAIVNRALQEAEDQTEHYLGHKIVPDHVLFALPSHALAGCRFQIDRRRPASAQYQPITAKEAAELWEQTVGQLKPALQKLPGVRPDWQAQTVTLAGFWVDGHLANDPVGLYGQTLSLAVYGITCQPEVLVSLEKLAERLEVEVYQMVAPAQALSMLVPHKDALLLDVGAGHTACYLIRNDALVNAIHIPLGGHFFSRSMAEAFHCDFDSAEALKLAYAADILSEADVNLVERSLHQPLQAWQTALMEGLSPLVADQTLPANLIFTGGSAKLPGLLESLFQAVDSQGFSFERSPELSYLGHAPLSDYKNDPLNFRGVLFALALSLGKTI
jgi:cell division ATPase FtsA